MVKRLVNIRLRALQVVFSRKINLASIFCAIWLSVGACAPSNLPSTNAVSVNSISGPFLDTVNYTTRDVAFVEACEQWQFDSADALKFFQQAVEISGPEWHHDFLHLGCEMRGIVEINDTVFDFMINTGSYGWIQKDSTYRWLGYYGSELPFLAESERYDE